MDPHFLSELRRLFSDYRKGMIIISFVRMTHPFPVWYIEHSIRDM